MTTWIASHATAAVIGGATITTIVAFATFGIIGAAIVWGMYGAGTYALAAVMKKNK